MSLDYALRRVANQLERHRERINRKRAFIVRCERIAASDDIDDSLLAELLCEGFDDHKLSKEELAKLLGLNHATIYRWLARKSMPQAFARSVIIKNLASLARHQADELTSQLFAANDDGIGRELPKTVPPKAGLFKPMPALTATGQNVTFDLKSVVIGDSWTGDQRPTFGVFAWSVVASGEFALTPAMAVADACLIVSAPGLSYFADGKQAFEPLPAGEGSAVALVALAGTPDCPTIPALRLKSAGPARAISGLLILSSKDGLPFEMANDRFSRWLSLAANCEGELQPPEFQVVELPFGSDLETWLPESTGFERVPVDPSKYEHSEAVRRRNFEVFDFRELRKAQERRLAACSQIDGHRLMLRLVSFPEANPSPDARDVYLRKHDGGELIIPLGGLVAAHLHDTNNGAVNAALNNGQECDLIRVVEEEGSYVPIMLNGPANRSGNSGALDNSLIFDASRVLHGFSAASRVALMLCVSVRRAACSGEWIARTSLGEPDQSIRSGGAA